MHKSNNVNLLNFYVIFIKPYKEGFDSMKKIFFHSIILSSTLFITQNIYADETFVYCANENREWKWLPTGRVIDNGEIVKVQGEWGIKKLIIIMNSDILNLLEEKISF